MALCSYAVWFRQSVRALRWTAVILVSCADKNLWSLHCLGEKAAICCPPSQHWGLSQCAVALAVDGDAVRQALAQCTGLFAAALWHPTECPWEPQCLPTDTSTFPPDTAVRGQAWQEPLQWWFVRSSVKGLFALFRRGATHLWHRSVCERRSAEKVVVWLLMWRVA